MIGSYRAVNGFVLQTMGKSMNEEDVSVIEQAGEKLKELSPNIRMIQDSDTQNALLNGEASVAYLYTSQVTAALAENPDLKVVYPEEGLGFGIMNLFIPKNAPDELNAYKFLDYILEPETAAKCFDALGYYCTTKAADDLVNPNLVVPDSVTKGEIVQNVSAEPMRRMRKTGQNSKRHVTKKGGVHTMQTKVTREEALKLLKKYNKEEFHILHALTVEALCVGMPKRWGMAMRRSSGHWWACFTMWILNSIPRSTAKSTGASGGD